MRSEIVQTFLPFKPFYPDYTLESLIETTNIIYEKFNKPDAITLDYYMRPKELGGLGYGRKQTV